MPPTGFVRPVFTQHIAVAPPTSQSTLTPATSLPLPPPPPSDSGLPQNWKTAKDPQGTTYYYHVITRKTQWTRPTETDADGSVTMELASSDEVKEDSSQAESLRAPCTPDGTPPPLATTTERVSSLINPHLHVILCSQKTPITTYDKETKKVTCLENVNSTL
ncbi:Histone-lysine N-methyltransferase SETD2 [Geodia barretti]|uniref:Histone-lysine N-methyltransferase SETD2 n=1 Tax=Geodia barretti TaxID=519541 RepID=A0AA35S8K0_GEOBA|nr:Histone-lysine N-methyltransferase SETD2 [Geodia barretti]